MLIEIYFNLCSRFPSERRCWLIYTSCFRLLPPLLWISLFFCLVFIFQKINKLNNLMALLLSSPKTHSLCDIFIWIWLERWLSMFIRRVFFCSKLCYIYLYYFSWFFVFFCCFCCCCCCWNEIIWQERWELEDDDWDGTKQQQQNEKKKSDEERRIEDRDSSHRRFSLLDHLILYAFIYLFSHHHHSIILICI